MNLGKPIPAEDLKFIANRVDVDKLRSMSGLITGATGWFGNWICSALDYMNCSYIKLDTRKMDYLFDCHYCIHLAHGEVSELIKRLQRSVNVKYVLFTSSGAVYDRHLSDYGRTKLNHENAFLASGLPVNIVRCFTFTGAGVCQKPLAIGEFINMAKSGTVINVHHPSVIRTYMYMAEMVAWLLNILLSQSGNIYDVGGAIPITMLDLAQRIAQYFPVTDVGVTYSSDIEQRDRYIPHLASAHKLGLKNEIGLNEAIRKTVEWEK